MARVGSHVERGIDHHSSCLLRLIVATTHRASAERLALKRQYADSSPASEPLKQCGRP